MRKKNKILTLFKFAILVFLLVCIPLYLLIFQKDIMPDLKSYDKAIDLLNEYKTTSIFIYIGFQIVQILIPILPGQFFQIAAGWLYGVLLGLLFSIIGSVIGTFITFYLSKLLGNDAMHLFFGEKRFEKYKAYLNNKKAYFAVFLIYLIPGLPKDLMCYAAGVSEMKLKPFLIISVIGRVPAMTMSLMFGAFYHTHNYPAMITVSVVVVIICLICLIYRKKIFLYIDKFYDKISD